MQQLQLDASGRHHPPEAAVVTVDGQSEALVVFWRTVEKTHTHTVQTCNSAETQPCAAFNTSLTGGVAVLDDGGFVSLRLLLAEGKQKNRK